MIRIKPGTMNAAPPSRAPRRPRTRQAQRIASWVEAGPGSRLQAATASSNSTGVNHFLRSTHRSRNNLIWVGGPPNPRQPIRPHSRTTTAKLGCRASTASPALSLIDPPSPSAPQPITHLRRVRITGQSAIFHHHKAQHYGYRYRYTISNPHDAR
jgi:hypothetical protein